MPALVGKQRKRTESLGEVGKTAFHIQKGCVTAEATLGLGSPPRLSRPEDGSAAPVSASTQQAAQGSVRALRGL